VLGTTALWFALAGAQSGFTFALVVAVAEYRKRVGILTFGRTALWGVLGAVSVLLPGLLSALLAHPERPAPSDPVTTPLAFAVLGAFWAVASLWVARRPGGGRRAESAGAPEPRPLVAGSASFAARSRQAAADPEVV
jgi:O-antigen/teichoic acid export membrane protein